jgi:hypothetical protein
MLKVMHHWYWGRARIGDYQVISSYIWAEKKYGRQEFPVFMIARGDRLITGGGGNLRFMPGQEFIEKKTGKPVHDLLVYDYEDGEARFRISYRRGQSILNFMLADNVSGVTRLLAKLAGFDGAYHRFTGDVILERLENEKIVERLQGPALWELMYFGKTIRIT